MKMPEHCRKCKLYQQISPEGKPLSGVCLAGYKNQSTDTVKASNQLKHGGEYPCSKSPIRHKVGYKGYKMLTNQIMNIKYVKPLHFRVKTEDENGN
jgi:hypothetical protein